MRIYLYVDGPWGVQGEVFCRSDDLLSEGTVISIPAGCVIADPNGLASHMMRIREQRGSRLMWGEPVPAFQASIFYRYALLSNGRELRVHDRLLGDIEGWGDLGDGLCPKGGFVGRKEALASASDFAAKAGLQVFAE